MSAVGALLGRVGPGLFQQAWVVTDLDAAEAAMRASLGCGEFVNFEMEQTFDVRGRPVPCTLSLGFARSGNLQLEVIQPIRGEGVHFEFLETHGPGPHHFGFLVDDLDATVAAATEDGYPAIMGGAFASVRISYLDTLAALGVYVELIEDPTRSMWSLMPWRDE